MSTPITENPLEELFGSDERIKMILDEDGITTNEDKINEYNLVSLNKVNSEMKYLFLDTEFPLTRGTLGDTDFETLTGIINQLTRGKFWIENNDSSTIYDKSVEELTEFRKRLSEQPPATTL